MESVNLMHVLVATVVIFLLGWLWYSPLLFFKPWMRLRGQDPAAAMANQKMPAGRLLVELIRCFVFSYLVAHLVGVIHVDSLFMAAHFSLFLWVAFPVVLFTGLVLWENVNWKVAAIDAGDWLVKLLVVSILTGLWR